jgi:hypothetical protein
MCLPMCLSVLGALTGASTDSSASSEEAPTTPALPTGLSPTFQSGTKHTDVSALCNILAQ